MASWYEVLHTKLLERQGVVGIVGLGYVGFPLARAVAQAGFRVLGFDTDTVKIATLQQGNSYLRHLPAQDIRAMQAQGFAETGDNGRLGEPDVGVLCLPTPLTEAREPYLSFVGISVQASA